MSGKSESTKLLSTVKRYGWTKTRVGFRDGRVCASGTCKKCKIEYTFDSTEKLFTPGATMCGCGQQDWVGNDG